MTHLMPKQSYLFRRTGNYYFRIRFPSDLRGRAKRDEIRVSLRTKNYSKAKKLVALMQYSSMHLFSFIRQRKNMDYVFISQLTRKYYQHILSTAEVWRSGARQKLDGLQELYDDYMNDLELNEEELKTAISDGDIDYILGDMQLEFAGVPPLEKILEDTERWDFDVLSYGFMRAKLQALQTLRAKQALDFGYQPSDPIFSAVDDESAARVIQADYPFDSIAFRDEPEAKKTPVTEPKQTDSNQEYPKLSHAFEMWLAAKERTPKTVSNFRGYVEKFCQWIGDLPVTEITEDHIEVFRDILLRLPMDLSDEELAMHPADVIAALDHSDSREARSVNTIKNKAVAAISVSLSRAKTKRYIKRNVCSGIEYPEVAPGAEKGRRAITSEELSVLFAGAPFTSDARKKSVHGDARFWIPIIALFTGARQSEIAGLELRDIQLQDGVSFFWIASNDVRRIKSNSSVRKIPIPQAIIDLGFFDYINFVKKSQDETRVFPTVRYDKSGHPNKFSNFWSGYKKTLGMPEEVDFHSFRHTLKRVLRNSRVDEAVSDALTGHANIRHIGRRYGMNKYGDLYELSFLKAELEKAQFPSIDFSKFYRRKY